MNRRLFLLLISLVAMVVAACAPTVNLLDENNLKDTSLLTGEPCEAPCWNNIIPGETSFRDALIIVQDDARYVNVEEVEPDEETDARLFGFSDGEGNVCCQVLSEDGETIDSMLFFLSPEMTLGEVIEKYDEPTYVLGEDVAEGQAILFLVYPDVPIVIYVYVAGSEGELSASSEVIGLLYVTESGMDRLINGNSFYNWEGYQSFTDYVDENYDFVGEDVGAESEDPTDTTEPED